MTTTMEFWGVEVKSGSPVQVTPDDDAVIHLSQASLGEVKKDKGSESINLYVNIGGQKLVIGILSGEKFPQIPFDLVFERRFELSHDWKNGSVYFCGYQSFLPMSCHESDSSDFEEYPVYDELPLAAGKPESEAKPVVEKANASESDSVVAKQKVKIVEPVKEDNSSSDEESEESDTDADAEVQIKANGGHDSDDGDESSESSEDSGSESSDDSGSEEEPSKTKVEQSKKRPIKSATKTPAPEKKAKFVTPQKTDGKKGAVHVATPHPSKNAGKAPASNEQAKQHTPSSSLPVSCKACNRYFKSDQALQAHSKAKHGAAA